MNFKTAGRESGGAAECGRSNAIDSEIDETTEAGSDETFVSWAAHNGGCSTASGMRPSTLARRVGVTSGVTPEVSR